MPLHSSTFEYLKPTDEQVEAMKVCRAAAAAYARILDAMLKDGPDKDHIMRQLRDVAMWANVAITRFGDGTPRGPHSREPRG